MSHMQIRIRRNPAESEVFLDGQKLNCVQALTFGASVDDLTSEVVLILCPDQIDIDLEDPRIQVIQETPEGDAGYAFGGELPHRHVAEAGS